MAENIKKDINNNKGTQLLSRGDNISEEKE